MSERYNKLAEGRMDGDDDDNDGSINKRRRQESNEKHTRYLFVRMTKGKISTS